MGRTAAIVGLGSIGNRHLKNIIEYIDGIDEILLYDVDSEKAKNACFEQRIKVCDKEEMLRKRPDIVFICTPNECHYNDSRDFIKAGIPVFIEKPATVSYSDCMDLARMSLAPVFVGCNMRYHIALQKAWEAVHGGSLGEIISARAYFGHSLKNWRPGSDYKKSYSACKDLGGGVMLDGIHELDYIIWLLGAVIKTSAMFENRGVLDIETEETADIILQHESKAISAIHLDYIQPLKRRGLEIVGTEGTFLWNSIGKMPEKMKIEILRGSGDAEILYDDAFSDVNSTYEAEVKDIFSVLNGKDIADTRLLTIHDACTEISILENIRNHGGQE